MNAKPNVAIVGATASGKTRLATHLASQLDAEIISVDSRQVYRGMDIGTGKDLSEYVVNNKKIPYHLIDIVEAGEDYHLAQFQKDALQAYENIKNAHKTVVFCGGSGLYLESLLKGHAFTQIPVNDVLRQQLKELSESSLKQIFIEKQSVYHPFADSSTQKRLIRAIEISEFLEQNPLFSLQAKAIEAKLIGIWIPPEIRRERIKKRLEDRLQNGMVEEVEALLKKGVKAEKLKFYGLEYKFLVEYLEAKYTFEEMKTLLQTAINQYAKRQMTYFRGMDKRNLPVFWIDGMDTLPKQLEKMRKEVQKGVD